jgi:hypothetical protein
MAPGDTTVGSRPKSISSGLNAADHIMRRPHPLERVIEHACQDTWRNIRDDLKRIQLAQLSSPAGTIWQVTDLSDAASKRLKDLKIKPPAPILDLS